tara:strand:- start:11363 stop:11623 length:261 start_codon:yes stop_codon:yes gene_type:complete
MDWGTVAWIKRGSRRESVLKFLSKQNNPVSANDVKKQLKIAMSQASATLKELRTKGLVDCLNPKDKIGKIHKINNKGKSLMRGSNG